MGERFFQSNAAAGEYGLRAGEARAQGVLQRSRAMQQAYSLKDEASRNSYLAMRDMAAMRMNQSAQQAAARNAAGHSGFAAGEGSKRVVEESVATQWEAHVANANRSNVIQDENARLQAAAYLRYGENAKRMADIQGDYYDALARNERRSRWGYLLGDSLRLGGSLFMKYGGGAGAAEAPGVPGGGFTTDADGFTGRRRS